MLLVMVSTLFTGWGMGSAWRSMSTPIWLGTTRRLLEPNMVFTDEPGIYIVGEIGVRVEDTVVCTTNGGREFTHFPRELRKYPVK